MIYLDDEDDSTEMAPGATEGIESCGGSETPGSRERGSWDELMEDGEFFEDEDPWQADDLKNG